VRTLHGTYGPVLWILLFVLTLIFELICDFLDSDSNYYHFKSRLLDRAVVLSSTFRINFTLYIRRLPLKNVINSIRDRFNILLGKTVDTKGIGYNTNQLKLLLIWWLGKGF
jgi:rod shape determining protein RodA